MAIDNFDHGKNARGNGAWSLRIRAYLTGRIDYTAIAHTLRRGSDGEHDDQEEAARIATHPSFAAVLGRRCLVLSGDRYLCILR